MLPKSHRLPSSQIRTLLQNGKRISSFEMQLIYTINVSLPAKDSAPSRFAVIVSTKIDKRATARNRIKRIIHESLHHLLPSMTLRVDGIFQVRKNIHDMSQVSIEALIKGLLQKSRAIRYS